MTRFTVSKWMKYLWGPETAITAVDNSPTACRSCLLTGAWDLPSTTLEIGIVRSSPSSHTRTIHASKAPVQLYHMKWEVFRELQESLRKMGPLYFSSWTQPTFKPSPQANWRIVFCIVWFVRSISSLYNFNRFHCILSRVEIQHKFCPSPST